MFCDTMRSVVGDGAAVELARGEVVVDDVEGVRAVVAVEGESRSASDEHAPITMIAIATRTALPCRIMVTDSHSWLRVQSL
jgi:hypothetical protein